jgi:cyclin K
MDQLLDAETNLLITIGFDLEVEHPYTHLLHMVNDKLKIPSGLTDLEAQQLCQHAWTFINVSLNTTVCVRFHPHFVAVAALYLAARSLNVELRADLDRAGTPMTPLSPASPQSPSHDGQPQQLNEWWRMFRVSRTMVDEIGLDIMEASEECEKLDRHQAERVRQHAARQAQEQQSPTHASSTSSAAPPITHSDSERTLAVAEGCVDDSAPGIHRVPSGADISSSPMEQPGGAASSDPSPASPPVVPAVAAGVTRSRNYSAQVDMTGFVGVH